MKPTIGFIGLGMMGLPMATRLQYAGYPLRVFNRTRLKAQGLVTGGAVWCDNPTATAQGSDVVVSMVSTSDVLKEVASHAFRGLGKDSVYIDMSTVSPAMTSELAATFKDGGRHFLHSPVLGSIPQATDGTLLLFVGGAQEAFAKSEQVLNILGKKIWRFESVGQASHAKLLCNMFIAGMMTTLVQALVYAQRAGVDRRTLLEILGHSALNSTMYQTKGASIIEQNFAPRFFLEHMLKDINLILDAGEKLGAPLPAIEVSQELFAQASQAGLGKEDYSAVFKSLESMPRQG
jgi:3-hydroxyisobutyrate dehydrogenase-like beta-hydroxyacid dehydrogenase